MIVLTHNNKVVISIVNLDDNKNVPTNTGNITTTLFKVAEQFPNHIIIWCHEKHKNNLNIEVISTSFHLKNIMLSFSCSDKNYFLEQIGYIEDSSPFIKINKSVKYPTWMMSSVIGAIYGTTLLKFKNQLSLGNTFDYVLNSIAKLGIPKGLFCYSDPNLLIETNENHDINQASVSTLFKFVRQHYKISWVLILFLNYVRHERKILLIPLINSLFYQRIKYKGGYQMELLNPSCQTRQKELPSVDVIIPTIGRKKYLYDVLQYLSKQTLKPKHVIIIEQNPDENSESELNYIQNGNWPFKVIHKFINQTGACNARNLALQEVKSSYVYLADDDNEFDNDLLENAINILETFKLDCMTMSYLKRDEREVVKQPIQWSTFGAGNSILKSKHLKYIEFNMALEHGYGEDVDFGMQIRNLGIDVIYIPNIKIIHLKAPIGGFRIKFKHAWSNDKIQPKPSPTVMLNRINNTTKYQLLGYQTRLLIRYYKHQSVKNPFKYFNAFKKQWNKSQHWATRLINN